MFGKMDRAAVEAVLGKGVTWLDEEDGLDLTYLADKMCSVGLNAKEQAVYKALQALYCSGF